MEFYTEMAYILSAVCFILGLKMLGSKDTARTGNMLSSLGMLIAVGTTLISGNILSYHWIIIGVVTGSVIGAFSARIVAMTAMPEMVALFNGSGGLASLLVALAVFFETPPGNTVTAIALVATVIIGGMTFTGSLIAWGKLSGKLPGKPVLFPGQNILNILLPAVMAAAAVGFTVPGLVEGFQLEVTHMLLAITGIALVIGITLVIPIGGADMPVVISLLNSMSGLAAGAAGIAIQNNVLIVSGALVGASGIILTSIMSRAMNRSLSNILFSGFGSPGASTSAQGEDQGEVNPINIQDAFLILEAARSVVFIPGYGMAVSQAQHAVKELSELMDGNGTEVLFAIHPVAGRMPGHMNVLLAEADVPYEQLVEMDSINPVMHTMDVAIVIGANDVVNPSAREEEGSPLYGMPVIDAHKAGTVFVLKRSMNPGFSGIENSLFFRDNTRMLFGDAKASVQGLVEEYRSIQNT
jgi:NAD(P) transhydrogenase subunit beta